jgi:uncharacterized protein (TIGR02217 family)
MTFYEVTLDPLQNNIKGGPSYTTLKHTGPSHEETRMSLSSRAFRKYTIDLDPKNTSQMYAIYNFYVAMQGSLHSFRFTDFKDYLLTNEPQTLTTGTSLSLIKTYSGIGATEIRPIQKPQAGTITLQRNAVTFPSSGNWSIDNTTGIITFVTSQIGSTITASGEFDTPVRFDLDEMMSEWTDLDIFAWKSVALIEIIPDN